MKGRSHTVEKRICMHPHKPLYDEGHYLVDLVYVVTKE